MSAQLFTIVVPPNQANNMQESLPSENRAYTHIQSVSYSSALPRSPAPSMQLQTVWQPIQAVTESADVDGALGWSYK